MEIETVNDLCEYLADLVGVYGGCKHAEKGDGDCPEKLITCCRIGFVTEISERIRKAVENENLLSAMDERKYGLGQSNIPRVSGSCVDCHYSGNGAHGCNRLMDGVTPKIDKSKGVECAHNGYVHYLPFSHDR